MDQQQLIADALRKVQEAEAALRALAGEAAPTSSRPVDLVDLKEAAYLTGRPISTLRKWSKKPLYGAQKHAGRWFFDREKLPPRGT